MLLLGQVDGLVPDVEIDFPFQQDQMDIPGGCVWRKYRPLGQAYTQDFHIGVLHQTLDLQVVIGLLGNGVVYIYHIRTVVAFGFIDQGFRWESNILWNTHPNSTGICNGPKAGSTEVPPLALWGASSPIKALVGDRYILL